MLIFWYLGHFPMSWLLEMILQWSCECRWLFRILASFFFWYIPRSGIAGSYSGSNFNFLMNLHTGLVFFFFNGCTNWLILTKSAEKFPFVSDTTTMNSAGTSIMDAGGQTSVSGWACLPHTSLSAPKPWSLRVTDYDAITEGRGKTCHCFSPGWRGAGEEPQDRSLPRAPPWDWHEAVKRGRQAVRVSALSLPYTHLLSDSKCALVWHTPCKFSTGWETEG